METDITAKLEFWADSGITHKIYSSQIIRDLLEAAKEIHTLRRDLLEANKKIKSIA